jgi:hypothetical protein
MASAARSVPAPCRVRDWRERCGASVAGWVQARSVDVPLAAGVGGEIIALEAPR